MSKQAREICMRCPKCGEFEVPVDWSKCARKEVQIVRCNKCGTEFAYCSAHRGRIVISRRIRKNREARLRHALRKKDEIIDYAANVVQRMENEAIDEYEHQLRLRLSLAATRTLNNFQRGCIHASGAFGHDVEGS